MRKRKFGGLDTSGRSFRKLIPCSFMKRCILTRIAVSTLLAGSPLILLAAEAASPSSASPAAVPAATSNAVPSAAPRGGRRADPDLGPLPEIHAPVPNTLPGLLGKPLRWKSTGVLV